MKTETPKCQRFRKFWGSWPQHYGLLDSGEIVYVRIRHGDVWIGVGEDEGKASDNAETVRVGVTDYLGVSGALEAIFELQERGYYFVPSNNRGE